MKCLQHTFSSCLSQTGDSQPCLVRCTECVLFCPLCCSLILRSQLVDSPAVCLLSEAPASDGATTPGALLLSEQDGSNAVVHLVIQRSAQVGTRVRGGCVHHCLHASFGVLLLLKLSSGTPRTCEQLCAANLCKSSALAVLQCSSAECAPPSSLTPYNVGGLAPLGDQF